MQITCRNYVSIRLLDCSKKQNVRYCIVKLQFVEDKKNKTNNKFNNIAKLLPLIYVILQEKDSIVIYVRRGGLPDDRSLGNSLHYLDLITTFKVFVQLWSINLVLAISIELLFMSRLALYHGTWTNRGLNFCVLVSSGYKFVRINRCIRRCFTHIINKFSNKYTCGYL